MNLDELKRRRGEIEASLRAAIETRNAMEGKMQSRYDTQREEWALECEILEAQLKSMDDLIEKLSELGERNQGVISLGSFVTLSIDGDQPSPYIILADHGGKVVDGVSVLSTQSPIGKAIIGRREGEKIRAKVPDGEVDVEILEVS